MSSRERVLNGDARLWSLAVRESPKARNRKPLGAAFLARDTLDVYSLLACVSNTGHILCKHLRGLVACWPSTHIGLRFVKEEDPSNGTPTASMMLGVPAVTPGPDRQR